MPQGVKTPPAKYTEFLKHYIVTGNVSASARAAGMPVQTGFGMVAKARKDPAFIKARESLGVDKAVPDGFRMLMTALEVGHARFCQENPDAVKLIAAGVGTAHIQDSWPAGLKAIASAVGILNQIRRVQAEIDGDIKLDREVTIQFVSSSDDDADDEEDGPELAAG